MGLDTTTKIENENDLETGIDIGIGIGSGIGLDAPHISCGDPWPLLFLVISTGEDERSKGIRKYDEKTEFGVSNGPPEW